MRVHPLATSIHQYGEVRVLKSDSLWVSVVSGGEPGDIEIEWVPRGIMEA